MCSLKTVFIIGAAAVLLATHVKADTISSWIGGHGNWSTAAAWSPTGVPNNTPTTKYDVVINPGFVGLDISPTINSLTLSSTTSQNAVLYAVQGVSPKLTILNNANINGFLLFGGNYPAPPPIGPGSLVVGGNLNGGANNRPERARDRRRQLHRVNPHRFRKRQRPIQRRPNVDEPRRHVSRE